MRSRKHHGKVTLVLHLSFYTSLYSQTHSGRRINCSSAGSWHGIYTEPWSVLPPTSFITQPERDLAWIVLPKGWSSVNGAASGHPRDRGTWDSSCSLHTDAEGTSLSSRQGSFLGQTTAQLGLMSVKFRNVEPRVQGRGWSGQSSSRVRISWDMNWEGRAPHITAKTGKFYT